MIFKVKFPCCHTLGSSSSSSASSFSFACSKGRPTTPTWWCFWGAAAATKGCKLINENAFIHASDVDADGVWSQNRFELEFRFVYGTGHDWQLMLLHVLLSRTCVATTCCFIRQRNVSLTGIAFRSLPTGNFSSFCCCCCCWRRNDAPFYGHTQ